MTGSRFEALGLYLENSGAEQVGLRFESIELIVGFALPDSARSDRRYWANDLTHAQARCWLQAGYEVRGLDLKRQTVRFVRSAVTDSYLTELSARAFAGFARLEWPADPLTISVLKGRQRRADTQLFISTREGLSRADPQSLRYRAAMGEQSRSRRRRPGADKIVLIDPLRSSPAIAGLVFENGRVTVSVTLVDVGLRRIDQWPPQRLTAAWDFVSLWQTEASPVLAAWPLGHSTTGQLSLSGGFVMPEGISSHECLRVCRWIMREVSVFEDGLLKVLYRKQGMSARRSITLALKKLDRYVRPSHLMLNCSRACPMPPTALLGLLGELPGRRRGPAK